MKFTAQVAVVPANAEEEEMAAAMAKIEAQETAEMAEMAAKDAHVVDYVNPEQVFTSFTFTTF